MARGEPLFRQWDLLKTLQANRFGLTADELAHRLGCTRRTVRRDLNVLASAFDLRTETRERGRKYWTLPPHFLESEKLQLTMTEMLCLYLSQQLLAPLAGTPFGDGLATALDKIKALLPTRALEHFSNLDEAFLIKSLAQDDYTGHGDHVAMLNDAILHQRVVRITYHSASQGRELHTELQPYGMILLAASLYCVGYLDEYDEVRTLKVSRLRDVRPTGRGFEKPATFSLARHTRGAFGVFSPSERGGDAEQQTIRVRFTGWAATNVREHRWHPSQRIVEDDGETVTATFELSSTVEFKRWLLGFGRHATVRAPESVAREIADELAAACGHYLQ